MIDAETSLDVLIWQSRVFPHLRTCGRTKTDIALLRRSPPTVPWNEIATTVTYDQVKKEENLVKFTTLHITTGCHR